MDVNQIFTFITTIISDQNIIARIILIILLSLYVLYSIVVSVQIRRLNTIVNQYSFSFSFKLLALFHTIFALGLFMYVIFLL